jgi:hypothetical protein
VNQELRHNINELKLLTFKPQGKNLYPYEHYHTYMMFITARMTIIRYGEHVLITAVARIWK